MSDHDIWVWDGGYCEGFAADPTDPRRAGRGWDSGWFQMEADADPAHPERGGVTQEDVERILRDDFGFTQDEINAARAMHP